MNRLQILLSIFMSIKKIQTQTLYRLEKQSSESNEAERNLRKSQMKRILILIKEVFAKVLTLTNQSKRSSS